MIQISVDSDIPYIHGVLEPYFDVQYLKGVDFTPETIAKSSALIIRTRTMCNKTLLNNSLVKVIASATIGFDHIDTNYCNQNKIEVTTSQGSNASAVIQYVITICASLFNDVKGKKIAIIGCGNVGTLLANTVSQLGMIPLCSDAPLRESGSTFPFKLIDLDEALSKADIVSLHVPLNREGRYKTANMVSTSFLKLVKKGAILINSSRGDVVDETALINCIKSGHLSEIAIDVWRNEPNINKELLSHCRFASFHIAGYSRKGKERATEMAVNNIGNYFGIENLKNWKLNSSHPEKMALRWDNIKNNISNYLDIELLSTSLKENPDNFEQLRSNYKYREEFF